MRNELYMELVGCLSEKEFSLDELVVKVKELFTTEGMAGVVGLLLSLFDEHLCTGLVRGKAVWQPEPCCEAPQYELHKRSRRRFRTTIGTVRIEWRRLRCVHCGRTVIPLREFLHLDRYQSKTVELERTIAEVVSEQSYRRVSRHLRLIGEIPVPKSTAHRWVMESGCDAIETDGKVVDVLVADGTGYKRHSEKAVGKNNRGELRVVLGVRTDGTVVPYGCWSGESWGKIGEEIHAKTEGSAPIAKGLVSDGELGIAEGLAHLVNEQQRCHWHMVHDLDYAMWQESASKEERRSTQKQLAGILGIELPEDDFEQVAEEDKAKIEQATEAAEEKIEQLVVELARKGYSQAASYVANAKDRLFSYVRFWLRYGLVTPRVSSMIERMMREIGRRLKRIAFGWSEKGAAKMARIIIKRITSAGEWEAYWSKRLRISGNVTLVYRGIIAT